LGAPATSAATRLEDRHTMRLADFIDGNIGKSSAMVVRI
jgi:hypothetical protein